MVERRELHKKGAAGSKGGCEPRGGRQKVGGRQARGEALPLGLKAARWVLGQVGGKAGLGSGQACESGGRTSGGSGGRRTGRLPVPKGSFPDLLSLPHPSRPPPAPGCGMLGVGPLQAITATTPPPPRRPRGDSALHGLSADSCSFSQNLVFKVLICFIE